MKTYTVPTDEELKSLIGNEQYECFNDLIKLINSRYDVEAVWNDGGKKWVHEYKYRRGGKTLCALYARENQAGFMVILGAEERNGFEAGRACYLPKTCEYYDNATTYHDGKWIMFPLDDETMFDDYMRLLEVKRKPNKK